MVLGLRGPDAVCQHHTRADDRPIGCGRIAVGPQVVDKTPVGEPADRISVAVYYFGSPALNPKSLVELEVPHAGKELQKPSAVDLARTHQGHQFHAPGLYPVLHGECVERERQIPRAEIAKKVVGVATVIAQQGGNVTLQQSVVVAEDNVHVGAGESLDLIVEPVGAKQPTGIAVDAAELDPVAPPGSCRAHRPGSLAVTMDL